MTEIIETIETIKETVPPKSEEVKTEEVKTEEPPTETDCVSPKSEEVKKICVNIKTYHRKRDDTTVTKIYNQTEYSKKYYEKIKDTLKEYVDCEICGCRYQKWNKGHHIKSKKHIKEVNAHTVLFYPTPPEMKDQTEIEKEENKDKFVIYRGVKFPNDFII
nr:MAG: hypothetical protein [Lake Baikal virophage 16]